MFEVRPALLVGMSLGGTRFGLERAAFHAVDLLHLLEKLLTFVNKRIHARLKMARY